MSSSTPPQRAAPVSATCLFKSASAMIGINALAQRCTFSRRGQEVVSSQGHILVWPDAQSKARINALLDANPSSVFVVEFAPGGVPMAEHSISCLPASLQGLIERCRAHGAR